MFAPEEKFDELVQAYLAHWLAGDIDAILSMHAPSFQYHDMTSGTVIGTGDMKQFLIDTFEIEGEGKLQFHTIKYPKKGSAFFNWTQRFSKESQHGELLLHGVELIVLQESKISSVHEFYYYDVAPSPETAAPDSDDHEAQISKLGLRQDQLAAISLKINEYFRNERPYLEPRINLAAVSAALGLKRNQVSFVINRVIGFSFYDYVNQHRINYAIERMSVLDASVSIVNLAIDSGFNTISGFYSAFKKQTGMTPSVYRRQMLENSVSARTRADDGEAL